MVHVDLDGASDIFAVHGWPYAWPDDPLFETGLPGLLDLFERARVRATFFAIAESVADPRKLELVREVVRRGHEVASHSLTHADLARLGTEEKRREIEESRARLEQQLGTSVRGFRAPGYKIDRESIALVARAGYAYDSSAFPTRAFARKLGVPLEALASERRPFGNDLVELALPKAPPSPLPFNPSYSLLLGMRYFRSSLERFLRRRAPLVLLYHLTDAAEPLPRARARSLRQRVFTLSNLGRDRKLERCRAMLELVGERFRLTSTADLLAEWSAP